MGIRVDHLAVLISAVGLAVSVFTAWLEYRRLLMEHGRKAVTNPPPPLFPFVGHP